MTAVAAQRTRGDRQQMGCAALRETFLLGRRVFEAPERYVRAHNEYLLCTVAPLRNHSRMK